MKNKSKSGHVLTVARSALSVSGLPYDLGGGLIGVACADYAANESGEYAISGVFDFQKLAGNAYTVGQIVDWDNGLGESVPDGDGASDHPLGTSVEVAASGAVLSAVMVNGNPGPGPSFS